VISLLNQKDSPERMAYSHKLWNKIKTGKFEVVISDVVKTEIDECKKTKRNILLGYLDEIDYSLIEVENDDRAFEIAKRFIDFGILTQSSFDDCQHVAGAIISGCDAIVSWNFRHIVNHKMINGVKVITAKEGYPDLLIYAPPMLLEDEGDEKNDT
jgi:predicted nucleic acid-binding protein